MSEPTLIWYDDSLDAVPAIEAAAALLRPCRRRRRPPLDDAGREHALRPVLIVPPSR